jgi:hypothetical protein
MVVVALVGSWAARAVVWGIAMEVVRGVMVRARRKSCGCWLVDGMGCRAAG